MLTEIKSQLLESARQLITSTDPSHDFEHAVRVLQNGVMIAVAEGADALVVIPACLFHDLITYPKNDRRSKNAQTDSARLASQVLAGINGYPVEKIEAVEYAIRCCSFSKGIVPDSLEAQVLQDADGLEATGAIAIMRTFSSTGSMQRSFYHPNDPFCRQRKPDDLKYAIDLFYTRLLKVEERMHTPTAIRIARRRTMFLKSFLEELEMELIRK